MKYLFLLSVILLLSCCSEKKNTDFKFEISNAVNVKMTFERLAEFEVNIDKKNKLQSFYQLLEIDSNPGFIGWFVKNNQQPELKKFINNHQKELILDDKQSFIWANHQQNSILFQKRNRETLNLTKAAIDYVISEQAITINLTPNGVSALRNYTLKHINKTLLLQINDELISSPSALGNFKDGTLVIRNIDFKILKTIKK
jgi:hypothetical protein|tara:strand:+ start:1932 stop:2531 length:600 start_codon:yes stop_codon:yes gene_type:complete